MLSSRSRMWISLSANSCSRLLKASSWHFCCSAAWLSSSSHDRSSWWCKTTREPAEHQEEMVVVHFPLQKFFHCYLFLGPKLVKHFLDLQSPVILQRVEWFCWHFKEAGLFNRCELVQNSWELWSRVRVWAPTACGKRQKTSLDIWAKFGLSWNVLVL